MRMNERYETRMPALKRGGYRRWGKPLIDKIGAAVGLVSLSPVLLVLGLVVRMRLGHPVLFRQTRPGLYGRPFIMYKYRTMTNEQGDDGTLLPDAQRMTSLGRFLRSTSLDELPELWNVLRGDMSLVGPRPLLMSYLDRYTPEQARRHEVKPGITGLAQVNGRNTLSWEERFRLDVEYVDSISLTVDLEILYKTILNVFARKGITADEHVTMPEYLGAQDE